MQTIMQPGEMEPAKGEFPFFFLPRREDLFASRARRFQALAKNHTLGDFLHLMGHLARSQQEALDDFPPLQSPAPKYLDQCGRERLPPLGVLGWRRDPAWREGLLRILAAMEKQRLQPAAREAIAALVQCGGDDLERYATGILAQDFSGVPAEVAPFVGAALQVYWTAMAADLGRQDLPRLERADLCPVCGSPPVAAIIRNGGNENGLRYLCCSLCSSQWHKVRGVCSKCNTGKDVTYYGIEGQPGPVTAESCDQCRTYLKIIKLENDPEADPLADDLAMLPLDLLMEQEGYGRYGINPLFHPGNA